MKRLSILSVLLLLFAGIRVNAQVSELIGDVEVIELGADSTFVFQVTFNHSSSKANDLKTVAEKTVLYTLMFNGVEGVNNDEKLVYRENRKYFENFFNTKDKYSPHQRFIALSEMEGKAQKQDNSEFQATFTVSVRYKALRREIHLQKLHIPDPGLEKQQVQGPADFN